MTAATDTADTAEGSELVGPAQVEAFQRNGAICLRGVFKQWIAPLQRGVEANMTEPGDYGSENTTPGEPGRFFDDYCNWQRIPEFKRFVHDSDAARIAAEVMGSRTAQFFHDHVLVKEPGTRKQTPWHQDIPYYCVDGRQTVSFWMPLDPVPRETSLRIVKGSHRWDKLVRPVAWLTDADFYQVLFSFHAVHGAAGNPTGERRRAFSHRWLGDDVRFVERRGRTSPPYPGIGQKTGERLRQDWFPVLWPREGAPAG
jgi:ectoine hydroxylase-related dioxygenase (phytanoyl-CoA dioxygenase family)